MLRSIIKKIRGQYWGYRTEISTISKILKISDLRKIRDELRGRQPSNPAAYGFKVYSQNDEDGIIEFIFKDIVHAGTFLEIGVENGCECNSHYLLLKGWRGFWVEADPTQALYIKNNLGGEEFVGRFKLIQEFATTKNIEKLYRDACNFFNVANLDLFSLDIDGQDLHVLRALLDGGARPSVLCLEYNSKFPANISISVIENEVWKRENDDYYGASLAALNDVAKEYGYRLVSCNLSGVNAFFVRNDLGQFADLHIEEIYQPFRIDLASYPLGFQPSLKFLRDALNTSVV